MTLSSRERAIYLFQEAVLFLALSYLVLLGGTFNGLVIPGLNRVNLVFVILIGVVWFIQRIIKKFKANRTGLDAGVMLIIAAGLISVIFSVDPRRSVIGFVILIIAVIVYYLFFDLIKSGLDPKLINKVLILVSCFILFFGVWELTAWYLGWMEIAGVSQLVPEATYRVRAFLGHPNFLAAFLNLIIPLVLAYLLKAQKRVTKLALIIWLGAAFLLVFFTSSRGGWLGTLTAVGVFILGILISKWALLKPKLAQLARNKFILVGIGLAIIILTAGFGYLLKWQSNHPTHPSDWSNILASRDYIWIVAWDMFKANLLTGNGLFTFGTEYLGVESIPPNMLLAHAHNFYFNLAGEQGLFGLIALGIYVGSFFSLLRKAWRGHKSMDQIEISGLAGAIFGLGAHSLFETPQSLPLFMILPAILIAQISAGLDWKSSPITTIAKNILLLGLWVGSVVLFSFDNRVLKYYEKGLQLASEGEWVTSSGYMDRVTELDPTNSLYWSQRGFVYGSIALDDSGILQDETARTQAINSYKKGLEIEPNYSVNWINLGLLYRVGGQYDQAQQAIENAVSKSPLQPYFILTQGNLYETIGQDKDAENAYHAALDLRPEWVNIQYFYENDLRKRMLDRWEPGNGTTKPETGVMLEIQNQFSIGNFQEVLDLLAGVDKINNPEAYELQGRAHLQLGEYEKAEQSFRTALWIGPKDKTLLVRIHTGLGEVAVAQNDSQAATAAFEAALDLLDRKTSYGEGKLGETQYSWYLFYKNSIKQDMLPGILAPVYSEGMVDGLAYLADWYCSNQQDELAKNVIEIINSAGSDMLEADSLTQDPCSQ